MHKKRDKKAISNVIILVLLILISILAVLIFWMMLRGLLKENAEQIYFGNVDVSIKNYDYMPTYDAQGDFDGGGTISVKLFRDVGIGKEDVSYSKFIFATNVKEYEISIPGNLVQLEESVYAFPITSIILQTDTDFNGDSIYDMEDIRIFANAYWDSEKGDSNYCECSDFNSDGSVDVADLLYLADAFGINPFESVRVDAYVKLDSGKEILVGSTIDYFEKTE